MAGCKSKNCKFYDDLCRYRKSLKSTKDTEIALSTPDPCTTCKRDYNDEYVPKEELVGQEQKEVNNG